MYVYKWFLNINILQVFYQVLFKNAHSSEHLQMVGWWLVREKSCCLEVSGLFGVGVFFPLIHHPFCFPLWVQLFKFVGASLNSLFCKVMPFRVFWPHRKWSGSWAEWGHVLFTRCCESTCTVIAVQKYHFFTSFCTPVHLCFYWWHVF